MTARRFFEPFWRYLAFSATKDLTSRPKLTRLLAELLDMSIAELLLYVQKYALPWLVLTKKRDVIQKIAEARGEEEIWRSCLDEANLGPILALLLTQETPDMQEYCMDLLKYISPHLSESGGLLELLRIEPIGTTLELLKAAGDADEDRKGHVGERCNTPCPSRVLIFMPMVDSRSIEQGGQYDVSRERGTQIQEGPCIRSLPTEVCFSSHGWANPSHQRRIKSDPVTRAQTLHKSDGRNDSNREALHSCCSPTGKAIMMSCFLIHTNIETDLCLSSSSYAVR